MVDETVRDRVARTLYGSRPHTPGYSWSWGELTSVGQEKWVRQADALLAAVPEIGLFERLEAWLAGGSRSLYAETTGQALDLATIEVELEETAPGLVVLNVGGDGPTLAGALSAALDQVETQERER